MTATCAHHRCRCPVGEHVRYCSDYCRGAADGAVTEALDMTVCVCGHAACASHRAPPPVHGTRPIENPKEEATC